MASTFRSCSGLSATTDRRSVNPHIKFVNHNRGYVRNTLTPTEWTADFRIVDYIALPGSPVRTRATFVIEDSHLGAQLA